MMTITAQDFTTTELIEALEKRGLQVLNAPLHAEITKAAREAEREECAMEALRIASANKEESRRHPMMSNGWIAHVYMADGASAVTDAIRARGAK